MANVKITKSIFGVHLVRFDCPQCNERLRSPLSDAGKSDYCPSCSAQFTVPGVDALSQESQRNQAALEHRRIEVESMRADKERRANEAVLERRAKRLRKIDEATAAVAAKDETRRQPQEVAGRRFNEIASKQPSKAENLTQKYNGNVLRFLIVGSMAFAAFAAIAFAYSSYTESGAGITDVVHSSGLRSKLNRCASYGIVEADVYYGEAFSNDTVVFDLLDGGSSTARRIDIVHLLLQFSDKTELSAVRTIVLARSGNKKFTISSSDMNRLADSYANGGEIWAFHHLPEMVRTLSGRAPYGGWTGGFLGVLKKQTEDLDDFISEWTGD